jgi:hypothetical protein
MRALQWKDGGIIKISKIDGWPLGARYRKAIRKGNSTLDRSVLWL